MEKIKIGLAQGRFHIIHWGHMDHRIITVSGDIDFSKDNLKFFENSYYCFLNAGNLKFEEIISFKKSLNIHKIILLHSYNEDIKKWDKIRNIIIGKDLMEIRI